MGYAVLVKKVCSP